MKRDTFIRHIAVAIIALFSLCGSASSQSLQKEENTKKPLASIFDGYLEIIGKTDKLAIPLQKINFGFWGYNGADFSLRYTTFETNNTIETEIDYVASFYYTEESLRYKIITETVNINIWNTEQVLLPDNDDNSPVQIVHGEPFSISFSPSFDITYSDDENQIPMQVYRYLVTQQNRIIGKWQFSSPKRSVVLELKEDGNIEYYAAVNNSENATLENWLRGTYNFQLDLPDNYALTALYNEAEYLPHDFESCLPTSYVAENVEFKAFITIELQDTDTIKVSFEYDRNNFAQDWKTETLIMERVWE